MSSCKFYNINIIIIIISFYYLKICSRSLDRGACLLRAAAVKRRESICAVDEVDQLTLGLDVRIPRRKIVATGARQDRRTRVFHDRRSVEQLGSATAVPNGHPALLDTGAAKDSVSIKERK